MDFGSQPTVPRQLGTESGTQGVALVVIEKEKAFFRWAEIGESPGHGALAFHGLMRVGYVNVGTLKQARRSHRALKAADANVVDGQGEEDVRVAQRIVVEEVARASPEVVEVEGPALHGDRQPEIVLLVTFAAQGQETKTLVYGKLQQGAGYRRKRRR